MIKTPRTLTEDEIEVRVQSIAEGRGNRRGRYYAALLLYKDARCDMRLLDETFGPYNWQRDHKTENGNLFCGVGVWDAEKGQWIWKWDAGSESNQEAEKGHASDSFKRAGVNWGIGRELYTAPHIMIELTDGEYYTDQNGKARLKNQKYSVAEIGYNDRREISRLVIADKKEMVRYCYG